MRTITILGGSGFLGSQLSFSCLKIIITELLFLIKKDK